MAEAPVGTKTEFVDVGRGLEAPVGTKTVYIDVGRGPEAFTVVTDHSQEGNLLPSVLPDLQAVKILEVIPRRSLVDNSSAERVAKSQSGPPLSEPVQLPTESTIDLTKSEEKFPEYLQCRAENEEKVLEHSRKVHRLENPFICLTCGYSTYNKTLLEEHVHIHQAVKTYECSHCEHKSTSPNDLIKHGLIHHPDNSLRCNECPFTAKNKSGLGNHFRSNHLHDGPVKDFVCKLCDFSTRIREQWHNHNWYHHKLYKCKTRRCTFSTTQLIKYNEHAENCKGLEILETKKPTKEYVCKICDFTTRIRKQWHNHNWYHHKLYKCKTRKCMFRTTRQNRYNEHVKNCNPVEMEEKTSAFQCGICSWSSREHVRVLLHLIHHPNQEVDESVVDISVLRKHGIR